MQEREKAGQRREKGTVTQHREKEGKSDKDANLPHFPL